MDPEHRETADLVVEVVSPGSAIYDRNMKAETYAALGVRELWLVDETIETVEVRVQTAKAFGLTNTFQKGEKVISTVFPKLDVLADEFFKD